MTQEKQSQGALGAAGARSKVWAGAQKPGLGAGCSTTSSRRRSPGLRGPSTLRGTGPLRNVRVHLETLGKGAQKLDLDGQANKWPRCSAGWWAWWLRPLYSRGRSPELGPALLGSIPLASSGCSGSDEANQINDLTGPCWGTCWSFLLSRGLGATPLSARGWGASRCPGGRPHPASPHLPRRPRALLQKQLVNIVIFPETLWCICSFFFFLVSMRTGSQLFPF